VGIWGYLAVDRLYRVTTVRDGARPPHLERGEGQEGGRKSRCQKGEA
jgi:hypothetical protein